MDSTRLAQIKQDQADKALETSKHQESLAHLDQVSNVVLSATSSLIQYLEGRVSKTQVVNQLESISTPDVEHIVRALQVLDQTIRNTPQTDLSGVTQLMQELVNEAKAIPKELPEAPEKEEQVDYTKQLNGLADAIKAVEKVVKAQKLVAEAPIVNVPETKVHVDAPNLEPIRKAIADLLKVTQKGQAKVVDEALQTHDVTGIIHERFDEYRVLYAAKFDDSEDTVIKGIDYFLKNKKVASLKYTYDKEGNLVSGKRV